MQPFDTVIVGAGPTGLACAIELKQRGLRAVLFDKGCLLNSIYHYPTHMTFFTTPEFLEIGDIPMTSLNEKPNRTEALKYYRRVADHFGQRRFFKFDGGSLIVGFAFDVIRLCLAGVFLRPIRDQMHFLLRRHRRLGFGRRDRRL